MVLRSAIDVTKNWSSSLNRLGFGFLAFATLTLLASPQFFNNLEAFLGSKISLIVASLILMLVFLSMVLGSVILTLGNFVLRNLPLVSDVTSKSFSEYERVKRAYLVGKTQNNLLAEILRDGTNKYDQAAGFFGLMLFTVLAQIFISIVRFFLETDSIPVETDSSFFSLVFFIFLILWFLLTALVWHSATNTITALDKFLSDGL